MTSLKRYIGLDAHKQQVTVAAVDSQQQVVLAPGEIAIQHFPAWAEAGVAQKLAQPSTGGVGAARVPRAGVERLHDRLPRLGEKRCRCGVIQVRLGGLGHGRWSRLKAGLRPSR